LPKSLFLNALIVAVEAYAALFTVDPAAFILSTILPYESTLTMPFVFLKLSDVLFAVWPS
jgi:hypothetical protein